MKKVLVIGAGGYFGSAVVDWLRGLKKFEIICTFRNNDLHAEKRGKSFGLDVLDYDSVRDVLSVVRPHIVINLVGRIPGLIKNQNITLVRDNFLTALNLMEGIDELSLTTKLVLVSSASEYQVQLDTTPLREQDNCAPSGIYGMSKNTMTRFASFYRKQKGLDIVVARVFNVVGPGVGQDTVAGSVISKLSQWSKNSDARRDITLGDLSAIRDFIDVRDMARALCHLGENKTDHLIYNLCSSKPTKVRSIIEGILKVSEIDVQISETKDLERSENPSFSLGNNTRLLESGFAFEYTLKNSIRDMWFHEVAKL